MNDVNINISCAEYNTLFHDDLWSLGVEITDGTRAQSNRLDSGTVRYLMVKSILETYISP